ncbi:MAG: hypothetical protein LBH14_07055 [Desulfobulbaceae bacterium]|jgi:hypothetical protein|nr:hypothetical protein [Desulfobulbaceae bacterium]
MTKQDIDALRALCAAATPGPWRAHSGIDYTVVMAPDDDTTDTAFVRVYSHETEEDAEKAHGNAEFIAAARYNLPRLLAALEAAEAQMKWLASHLAGNTFKCPDDQRNETCLEQEGCEACWLAAAAMARRETS